MPLVTSDARTLRLVAAYEGLEHDRLGDLLALYHPNASFKDPFNEVLGQAAIRRLFEHMFEALDDPRFVVTQAACEGDQAFLTWTFHFRRRGGGARMHILGATHLHYAPDGRVHLHRDYWDAAEELYAKLPVLGALMRWLQRRLASPAP